MENKKQNDFSFMEKMIRREFPKVLKRKKKEFTDKKKILKNFEKLSQDLLREKQNNELKKKNPPTHPWRMCALGSHWVKIHPRKVKPTEKNPSGYTIVDGHCRINPSKKEQIVFDEIRQISERHFKNLKNKPCPLNLGFKTKKKNGSVYDDLIAGWTKYWNEIFKPIEPLDPNFVKALIASESGFDKTASILVSKKGKDKARGLMQITDETIRILNNPKGELKDHLIKLSKKEIMDPSANIYSGIRWLFHKKRLTSGKLGREATWQETIINFKGYMKTYLKNPKAEFTGLNNLLRNYELLKKCEK